MKGVRSKYIFGVVVITGSLVFFTLLAWLVPRVEAGAQEIPRIEKTSINVWQESNSNSFDSFFIQKNTLQLNNSYSQEFLSKVYEPNLNFSTIAFSFEEDIPVGTKAELNIRVKQNNTWGSWENGLTDEEDELDPEMLNDPKSYSEIFYVRNGQAFQIQVLLSSSNLSATPTLSSLTAITTPKKYLTSSAQVDSGEFRIIPREEWIDAPLTQAEQEEEWPNEYVGIEKFIIHHSGKLLKDTDDDNILGKNDFLTLARGIYHWQAIARNWGDMGYQYVIDPLGNVYEGKAGDDGIVGGHTVRSAACFKGEHLGYNKGTIGIAILGDYDLDTLTPAAKEAVAQLIATKAREFELDPLGNSFFIDRNMPNIIGHNKVDCTLCPGSFITSAMGEIREKTKVHYDKLMAEKGIVKKATLISQSDKVVNLKKDETKEVWLSFRNDGNIAWHTYSKDKVYLADKRIQSKLAALNSTQLATVSDNSNEDEEEQEPPPPPPPFFVASNPIPNIKPGETMFFKFNVSPSPVLATEERTYVLTQNSVGWFPETEIKLTVNNVELNYGGLLKGQNHPVAVLAETDYSVKMSFENTGGKPWLKDDLQLVIEDKNFGTSRFTHSSWPSTNGSITQDKETVQPGESTSFSFKMRASTPGFFRQKFYLVRTVQDEQGNKLGAEEIVGTAFDILTRVDSPWQGQVVSHNIPSAMLNIWRPAVTIKLRNTGSETWRGGSRTIMKVHDVVGTASPFYDRWDWINKEVAAWQLERSVKPGDTATFKLYLDPPKTAGLYDLRLEFFNNGKRIYINNDKYQFIPTRVDSK